MPMRWWHCCFHFERGQAWFFRRGTIIFLPLTMSLWSMCVNVSQRGKLFEIFVRANLSLPVPLRSLIICRTRMPRNFCFLFGSRRFSMHSKLLEDLFHATLWRHTWLFKQNGILYTTSAGTFFFKI